MEEIKSFGPTEWTKNNEDLLQKNDIESAYKELLKSEPDYGLVTDTLNNAADEILKADSERRNRNSQAKRVKDYINVIHFTPNIKSSIAMGPKSWIERGYMVEKEYSGMCVACGKLIRTGDIVLADTHGESSCICLECTDEGNELGEDFELILCK